MRQSFFRVLYLGLIVQLCTVIGQQWGAGGGGRRPPPMPLNQLPPDPERQADMMENRPWPPGPFGYHMQPHYPRYQQPYPYYQQPMPQPYQQQSFGQQAPSYQSRQIIPLNVMQQYSGTDIQTSQSHGAGQQGKGQQAKPIPAANPNANSLPPPQNIHTGTVVGNKHSVPSSHSRRKVNVPLKRPSQSVGNSVKSIRMTSKVSPPNQSIRRIQWKPNAQKWRPVKKQPSSIRSQPPARRLPPPAPSPPRPPLIPPGPPMGPPPAAGGLGAGSQDGPCIPSPVRPVQRGNTGGFPPVRHQPRVPYRRRYRRTPYNLTGCTCTDIQDIDPLGGDNYLTKAGYCHVFQYYCACPSTVQTRSGAPPPG